MATINFMLDVERIEQNTLHSCGAACVQMILEFLQPTNGNAEAQRATQNGLLRQIQNFNSIDNVDWDSSPDGITNVLNVNFGGNNGRRNKFRLFKRKSKAAITNKIIALIQQFNVPAITLVFDDSHWVVINGYHENQTTSNGTTAIMKDIWVTNPLPDDLDTDVQGNIDLDTWLVRIVGKVDNGGKFDGFCLAVCDPPGKKKLPASAKKLIKLSQVQNIKSTPDMKPTSVELEKKQLKKERKNVVSQTPIPPSMLNKDGIIHPKNAKKITSLLMNDRGFAGLDFLKKTLKGYRPGQPVLVQELDKKNDFYYIVPLRVTTGGIRGLFCIDSFKGYYIQSSYMINDKKNIQFNTLTKDEILKVLQESLKNKKIRQELPDFAEALAIHPVLVWRPCLESFSPFRPFYMVYLGSFKVYVRIDKKVFTKLTTDVSGA